MSSALRACTPSLGFLICYVGGGRIKANTTRVDMSLQQTKSQDLQQEVHVLQCCYVVVYYESRFVTSQQRFTNIARVKATGEAQTLFISFILRILLLC